MDDRDERERKLSPETERALAEAEARREAAANTPPAEHGGPEGPEPTRCGDWGRRGIAVDF
jgi:hypothetical protein